MKHMQLREYDHVEKEFYNRFFSSRSQLGLIAQELQPVCPQAVALIPERRYTSSNGTQSSSRNVLMVKESHVMFVLLGGVQEISKRLDHMHADYWTRANQWDSSLDLLHTDLSTVTSKQVELEKISSEYKNRIYFLAEKNSDLVKSVSLVDDRVSRLVNEVSSVEARMRALRGETSDRLRKIETETMMKKLESESEFNSIKNDVNQVMVNGAELTRRVESTLTSVQNRLRAVETYVLILMSNQDREKTVLNRKNLISSLLRLEAKREHISRLNTESASELAVRRERFDLHLLHLREESELRILHEKNRLESEKSLEFEREKLSSEMAVRIETARLESEMRLRDRRDNEDVNLRELAEKNAGEKEKIKMMILETANIISTWVKNLYSSPENLFIAIGSIVGLVAGIYVAKEGAQLLREDIGRRLGKPDLVRQTSRKRNFLWFRSSLPADEPFKDVVMSDEFRAELVRLARATRSAHACAAPLMNLMFYGEPGTGKTMVAKRFAEFSGLDYAIMSGGDVAPLGPDGVSAIHKLFKWVDSSPRGVLLFIDEAESFLNQRSGGMSENLRNAITAFLFHTGTASRKFIMILATNRPGDIDSAIIDRIDEKIEFPLPSETERKKLIRMYSQSLLTGARVDEKLIGEIATKTNGFSGREISKLVMSVRSHFDREKIEENRLEKLLLTTTDAKVKQHLKQVHGYVLAN
jgi:ATPase family AAA domain-containing protein 3A/B